MSTDTKTMIFPESTGSGTSAAEIAALMNNNNGNWNNPFIYLVWMMFANRFWNNGENGASAQNTDILNRINELGTQISSNQNTNLTMDAINGNHEALHALQNSLGVDFATLQGAINGVQNAITQVGGQVGMSAQQVINSVLLGNKDLTSALQTCCCENKQLVTTMGYEGQLRDQANTAAITSRIDQLSNGVQTGFASTAYATQAQTNSLQTSLQNQTQTIIDKISAMEANAQQDKINSLTAQLTAANSRAERQAELQPIIAQLNAIKSAQPSTVAVQYPQLTAVPNYVAYGYNNYSGNGFWS